MCAHAAGLRSGGVAIAWCGIGLPRDQAAQAARRESVRALATLGTLGLGGMHISRSACDGLAAVALSLHPGLGIDVEAQRPVAHADYTAWLHPKERALSQACGATYAMAVWVRKEAVLKALGVGLVVPPADFETGGEDAGWRRVHVGRLGAAQVCSVATPLPEVLAALALQQATCPAVFTYVAPC